jgi:hypothetical protein
MPRIDRLHQNISEWNHRRMQRIGVSGAPVIMGETAGAAVKINFHRAQTGDSVLGV